MFNNNPKADYKFRLLTLFAYYTANENCDKINENIRTYISDCHEIGAYSGHKSCILETILLVMQT